MTLPPKASRFHASPAEAVRPHTGADPAAETRPPAGDKPDIRVELHKKADLPPRFGEGPMSGASAASSDEQRKERMMQTEPVDDGFGDMRFPTAGPASEGTTPAKDGGKADPADAAGEDLEAKLAAIRAEKLSDRQLRIARRIAALHQIPVESDEEAVLRLRERGIDPSQRAALSQILSSEGSRSQASPSANAPAVVPRAPLPASRPNTQPGPALPSREQLTEDRRAAEILLIQRDIARRRRRRLAMLAMRLMLFVIIPTFMAGWYYFRVASPLYATHSQFQIQMADGMSGSSMGGLFSASQLATNPDSVGVQSYLTSRDAMLRLDGELGYRRAFQDPSLDAIKRLPENASNEATYELYQKSVRIGYDPTEGMINMEVIAPDPELSRDFSLALIKYAEGQVDQMTARLRDDQMKGAIEVYEDAEAKVLAAQQRVQELQQKLGVLDPVAEGSVIMNQVAELEMQLATKELELGQLLANPSPQQSRVTALRGDITRLQEMIARTRLQLTEGNATRSSLAAISGELRIAESDLATRQELLAAAAAQMETARVEASKQVRYLSLSVAPVAPDEATYPKAVQNTLVAFLIFSGIYLMLSLTASILREQVSS